MKWFDKIAIQLFEPDREVTPGELVFFKIFELFVVSYTIKYAWEWGLYTQLRNTEAILPLGLANYIDISIFFDHQLSLVLAGLITLLGVFSYFRKGPNWLYAVVFVLLHMQYVIRFSQGEIPHSQNLIGLSVLCLAIGILFFPGENRMPRFVLGAVILFTGLGYTSAFFSKLIGSGIHWFNGEHLQLWIFEKRVDILSREGTHQLNYIQQVALNSSFAASIFLLLGWITELCGFMMWWKKMRPYITLLLIGMHFFITMIMNIRFDVFIYELILIGFPWHKWFDGFIQSTPKWISRII